MRWNVHPLLSDTVALVRTTQARTVIPAFCDRTQLAALGAALGGARRGAGSTTFPSGGFDYGLSMRCVEMT